jgi:hypothetical protein
MEKTRGYRLHYIYQQLNFVKGKKLFYLSFSLHSLLGKEGELFKVLYEVNVYRGIGRRRYSSHRLFLEEVADE